MLSLFVSFACLSVVATALPTSVREVWRLPVGIAHATVRPTAAHGNVYAANAEGTVFAVRAADGRLLWAQDGNPELSMLAPVPGIDVVIAFLSNVLVPGQTNNTVQALDAGTGRVLWSHSTAAASVHVRAGLVLVKEVKENAHHGGQFYTFLTGYTARTGAVAWSTPVTAQPYVTGDMFSAKYYFAPTAGTIKWVGVVVRLSDGARVCSISMSAILGRTAIAGDTLAIAPLAALGPYVVALYDVASGCTPLDVKRNDSVPMAGPNGETMYLWTALDARGQATANHSLVATWTLAAVGQPAWVKTFPHEAVGEPVQPSLSCLPHSGHLVASVAGRLVNLNASTGAVSWQTTQAVPVSAASSSAPCDSEVVFPLGNRVAFVPNLQGWTLLGATGSVMTVLQQTLDNPTAGTVAGETGAGQPLAVYADVRTGALVALSSTDQ